MSLAKDKEESFAVLIFLKQPRINIVVIEMNGKLIVLLYAVALSEFCSHVTEGIISSCKNVTVNKGEGTNITCHFGEDISKIQKDVKLYHEKDSVLTIAWNDGLPDIHSKPGYQFDGRITTNITVKIPSAQIEHAGKYACQVVLSKAFEATPCTLIISNPCAVNLNITEREHKTTVCKYESNMDESSDKIDKATIAVLGVSLALSVCANIYFLYKKRSMKRTDDLPNVQSKLLPTEKGNKNSEDQDLPSVQSKLLPTEKGNKNSEDHDLPNVQSKLLPTEKGNKNSEDLSVTPTDLSEPVVQTVSIGDNQSSSDKKTHNRNDSACYSMDDML